ncbi:MAG: PAS domain-containing protein [Candidatus Latescibacteria bacterium]|nr:PAS domain-containing protein [Candidatus Latescibacterota bacterium]
MAPPSVRPRDMERPFGLEELFFSITDLKGVILTGNEVFVRVSGYELEALVGKPHKIIRHPDVPRAVFRLLWDYLEAGRVFAGFVKNMARDGCYYWVVALLVRIQDGYLSIRFKPSSPLLGVVRDLYAQMLAVERAAGDRQEGMRAATEFLVAALKEKGFASYDSFMHAALVAEMSSRRAQLGPPRPDTLASGELGTALRACGAIDRQLDDLFSRAGFFLELVGKLDGKFSYLLGLSEHIHLVSMNAIIASHHLDEKGRGVAVVTHSLSAILEQIISLIAGMTGHILGLTGALRETAFSIATAKLQVEMTRFFLTELRAGQAAQAGSGEEGRLYDQIGVLVDCFVASTQSMLTSLKKVQQPILPLIQAHDQLVGALRRLNAMRVTGKVQAAYIPEAAHFQGLFDEIFAQLQGAKAELRELSVGMNSLRADLPAFERAGWNIQGQLTHFARRGTLAARETSKETNAEALQASVTEPEEARPLPDTEVATVVTAGITDGDQGETLVRG